MIRSRNNVCSRDIKSAFLFQTDKDQYLLAKGPFLRSFKPAKNKWSLFHPPFFLSKSALGSWYIPSTHTFFSKEDLLSFLNSKIKKRKSLNIARLKWQKPLFSDFETFFLKAKKQIALAKLKKVVPVFFEIADYKLEAKDMPALLYSLLSRSSLFSDSFSKKKPGAFFYAFWSGKKAILGFTPEWLFKKEGFFLETMALAGTAKDDKHDLLKDLKERKEQKIVVETLKTTLKKLGKLKTSKTYVFKVGNIKHLRTDFNLLLKKNISFERLCRVLHPTPALGGFPKKPALDMLESLDKKHHSRMSFGAPFGITFKEKSFCLVAIRNIQFMNNKVYIGSGVGLIKESKLKHEWQELKNKRQVIKDIL